MASQPNPRHPVRDGGPRTLAWLLLLIGGLLTLTMPRFIYVGDPIAIQATTINWLTTGDISVSQSLASQFGERGQYFFEHPVSHKWYSKYGALNTVLYAPPLLVERMLCGKLTHFDQLDEQGRALRCLLLNVGNILVTMILATTLYRTALLYDAQPRNAGMFVVLALFGTFLWHYVRAQTVEIFQVTLFTAAYYHLVRYSSSEPFRGSRIGAIVHAGATIVLLGLLCLSKLIFVVLIPLMIGCILWVVARRELPNFRTAGWRGFARLARAQLSLLAMVFTSTALMCGLLLLLNWYRFGSPWTTGYQQFERESTLFRPTLEGLAGYLVDWQKSVLIYFPLLPLAMFGVFRSPRQTRAAYAFAWAGFLVLYGLSASFVNWRGDWCYGPRYLLFAMPVLSLPVLSLLGKQWAWPIARYVLVGGVLFLSLGSVNSLLSIHGADFFAAFRARECFEDIEDERVSEYFHRPHWQINRDLRRFRLGRSPFPPLELLRDELTPAQFLVKIEALQTVPLGNYYWPEYLSPAIVKKRAVGRAPAGNPP